jgi:hypothetical protein
MSSYSLQVPRAELHIQVLPSISMGYSGGGQTPGVSGTAPMPGFGGTSSARELGDSLVGQDGKIHADSPMKQALLQLVAGLMDANPAKFGKPDGGKGETGTWKDELLGNNDKRMNKAETREFYAGLEEVLKGMGAGGGAKMPGGGGGPQVSLPQNNMMNMPFKTGEMPPGFGTPGSERLNGLFDAKGDMSQDINKKAALLDVARFMDSRSDLFGKPQGQKSWVDEVNLEGDFKLSGKESKKMQAAADIMQGFQKLQEGGFPVDLGAILNPAGKGGLGGGQQMSGFGDTRTPRELGDSLVGQDGKIHADSPMKQALLQLVAGLMDANPAKFGKPDGGKGETGTWKDELLGNNDKRMNKAETREFYAGLEEVLKGMGAGGGAKMPGGGGGPQVSLPQNNMMNMPFKTGEMPPGFGTPGSERLNGLFDAKGDMSQDINKKAALLDVARFMDSRSDLFGKPQGQKSWVDEVNLEGDFKLSGKESKEMKAAADMLQASEKLRAGGFQVNLNAMG